MEGAGRSEWLRIQSWDSQAVTENWGMDPWETLGGMGAEERVDHRPIRIVVINYYSH